MPSLGLGTWQIEGRRGRRGRGRRARARLPPHRHRARLRQRARGGRGAARGRRARATRCGSRPRSGATTPTRRACAARPRRRCADLGLDQVDLLLFHWPQPGRAAAGHARRAAPRAPGRPDPPHRRQQLPQRAAARGDRAVPDLLRPGRVPPLPVPARGARRRPLARDRRDRLLAAGQRRAARAIRSWREIAESRGCTPAQVALRWLLDQTGVAAVPKAATHENRRANLEALDSRR